MLEFSLIQFSIVAVIFIWSGFVRSGLGFGGAALALPLMLIIENEPLLWLPIIASHLLIFSGATVYNRLHDVDWPFLRKALIIMIIPKIAGVLGLLNLPGELLSTIIYLITLLYALTYVFDYTIKTNNVWVENLLLILGGYASGTSLIGAPLISAVFAQHVEIRKYRNTLFILWMILVIIKMSTFIVFKVDMQVKLMVYLLPFVAIGHVMGLKFHQHLIEQGGSQFKVILGCILFIICGYGLVKNLILS